MDGNRMPEHANLSEVLSEKRDRESGIAAIAAPTGKKPHVCEMGEACEKTVIRVNETVLRQKSWPTSVKQVEDLKLIPRIKCAMQKGWIDAYGLAAIQIGEPYAVAYYKLPDKDEEVVLINPVQINRSMGSIPYNGEGCMSRPGKKVTTWRALRVKLRYLDMTGSTVERWFGGVEAQIVQHELDHMEGITNDARTHGPSLPGRNEPCDCGSGKKSKRCCYV